MSDLTIKQEVEAQLQWGPNMHAAGIGVAVKDGILTLTGRVVTHAQKMAAGRAAQGRHRARRQRAPRA